MKKVFFIVAVILVSLGCASTSGIVFANKKNQSKNQFSVKENIVYLDSNPIAKYQAKTFSLDGGELVEEYNLLLLDNKIKNKQTIGDLIDYIEERHPGAEVEIEVDSNGSIFNL